MMRAIWLAALGTVVGCVLRAGQAAPTPQTLLPADVLGFLATPQWEAASVALAQSPYGQLWADPAMRPFAQSYEARFRKEILDPLHKTLGFDVAACSRLWQGPVILAWTATPPDNRLGQSTGFLLIADTGSKSAQLATNLAVWRQGWTNSGKALKPIRLRGVEFSVIDFPLADVTRILDKLLPDSQPAHEGASAAPPQPIQAEWTIGQAGSLFLVSDSAREIDKVLALQAGPKGRSLAENKTFAADAPQLQDAQACLWINVKAAMDQTATAPAGEGKEPGPLSLRAMLPGLGFGGLQSASLTARGSADGTHVTVRVRVPQAGRKGLFQILGLETKDSSPPAFIPADVLKFSRARVSLAAAWGRVETMLAEVSPAAAGFLKFIIDTAGKDKDENFDLRQKLIARLGDDLISYTPGLRPGAEVRADSPPSVVLVGAPNPDQVAVALKSLPSLLPPETTRWKEREFLGRTIYSVTVPQKQDDGTYATGPAWFFAAGGAHVAISSDGDMIQDYLRGADAVTRTLRQRPGLAEAAQAVGGTSTGCFSYENSGETARRFFALAKKESFNAASILGAMKWGSQVGLDPQAGPLAWGDFFLLPSYDRVARYFHFDVSTLSQNSEGFTYRSFAPTPPGLKK
jgi:hypothetical protein